MPSIKGSSSAWGSISKSSARCLRLLHPPDLFEGRSFFRDALDKPSGAVRIIAYACAPGMRSEEHTSELQSQSNLVCRLLLEKKKIKKNSHNRSATRLPVSTTW